MEPNPRRERHYSVVRFYSDYAHGIFKEVLESDLTLEEARRMAREQRDLVKDEDVVIQDQDKRGLEAEVPIDEEPNRGDFAH